MNTNGIRLKGMWSREKKESTSEICPTDISVSIKNISSVSFITESYTWSDSYHQIYGVPLSDRIKMLLYFYVHFGKIPPPFSSKI